MRKQIVDYINNKIIPQYDNNIGGHGIDHILQVIERSNQIIKEFALPVSKEKAFVIAAYHDLGYLVDPENHESVSANMFFNDSFFFDFYNEVERKTISEAIEDHRASLEYEARNIYGKIVSSADREISVDNMLSRSLSYQYDKHKEENPTIEEIIKYSFKKLNSKYGKSGYAKMYFADKVYQDYKMEIEELLSDFNKFYDREIKIAKIVLPFNNLVKK